MRFSRVRTLSALARSRALPGFPAGSFPLGRPVLKAENGGGVRSKNVDLWPAAFFCGGLVMAMSFIERD
jgi:hypothetical protein